MKLAILGGSFNPVHLGHLCIADAVLETLGYERIILVPAYRSPFKLTAKGMESSSRDRLEMLSASVSGDPRLAVDDCEIKRQGISYTVDTIKDIIKRNGAVFVQFDRINAKIGAVIIPLLNNPKKKALSISSKPRNVDVRGGSLCPKRVISINIAEYINALPIAIILLRFLKFCTKIFQAEEK